MSNVDPECSRCADTSAAIVVSAPQSPADWAAYYELRWRILREPWGQPRGSERDDLEDQAVAHRLAKTAEGLVVGVGRLHLSQGAEARVRYMAVDEGYRGHHIGARLLYDLELAAWTTHGGGGGADTIILDAREKALPFYERHGYQIIRKGHMAFGDVQHWVMTKQRPAEPGWFRHPEWVRELSSTWRDGIPISDAMGIRVDTYTDWEFATRADLSPNVNVHMSMFAGSIYSMATLTGWGATYMALKEKGLAASVVLAEATIKYMKPLTGAPRAVAVLGDCVGDLKSDIVLKGRARYVVPVGVYSDDVLVGKFVGSFAVIGEGEHRSQSPNPSSSL